MNNREEALVSQSLFTSEDTIELRYGDSHLILKCYSNFFAVNQLTKEQEAKLIVLPGIQRFPDCVGHSVFKILGELTVAEISGVCNIAPIQMIAPLYKESREDRFSVHTGQICVRFKENTSESMIDDILNQHQLMIFRVTRRNFKILKATDPLQDLIKTAFELQKNSNIDVAEPDFIGEIVHCANAVVSSQA